MTQSRPGTCTFLNIRLPLGSTTSGGVYTKLRKTSTYFDIDLRKSWIVPKGKVLYLGDFVVHIESKKLVQGRGYVYTYNVYNSKNQQGLDSISHTFRDRYPELSGHFKNGAEFAAPLLLNETFHSLSYKNGWAKRQNDKKYDAYIDEGQYLVDTKTATCAVFGIRRLFKLPGKYDIELTSTWKAGMVNRFYGLVLGIDLNNLYRFGVAANGAANASLIMNGALQTNPLGLTAGATFRNNGTNTNVHKIKVRGNTISYYVNDTLIGKTQSRLKFNKWFVGVTVCDKQKVAFDNLRISQQW